MSKAPIRLPPGVTYRQLHYWVSKGYIFPIADTQQSPGSGHHREWTPKYVRKLTVLGKLRMLGIDAVIASDIAEHVSEAPELADSFTYTLEHGVKIHINYKEFFEE